MELYGDGIHDDTSAIQQLLDCTHTVRLTSPKVCYLISRPLRIHSNQSLVLDRFCHIKLMANSNCRMLVNAESENSNIEVIGGIWDLNNLEQGKNPFLFPHEDFPDYDGFSIYFNKVKNLRLAHITMKDPVTFAITLEHVEQFTVEDITFDFNYGNPYAVNMDGVHLNGGCKFGVIRNLKGTCYDDLVALNSPEGDPAPISDIEIDGIFAENCHSAIRMHSWEYNVENISISHIYGTYYQYCIGFSTPDGSVKTDGYFDNIVLKDIHASKAVRYSIYQKDGFYVYPLIWLQGSKLIKNISIDGIYRDEKNVAVETVGLEGGAKIENITVRNAVQKNDTGEPMPFIKNHGTIDNLNIESARIYSDELIENPGVIKNKTETDIIRGK